MGHTSIPQHTTHIPSKRFNTIQENRRAHTQEQIVEQTQVHTPVDIEVHTLQHIEVHTLEHIKVHTLQHTYQWIHTYVSIHISRAHTHIRAHVANKNVVACTLERGKTHANEKTRLHQYELHTPTSLPESTGTSQNENPSHTEK